MPPAPRVSFLIPCLNRAADLTATLESIFSQVDRDWECVVMDGGSSDETLPLLRRLSESEPRLRFRSEPDRGIYDAMNKTVSLATGRFYLFLGAGDLLQAGSLGAVQLPAHERALVHGDALWGGKVFDGPFSPGKLARRNLCHQTIFYGAAIFRELGGYVLTYPYLGDWEFNLRCFEADWIEKRYIPVVIARYQDGGASSQGDPLFERDRGDLFRRHLGLGVYLSWLAWRAAMGLREIFNRPYFLWRWSQVKRGFGTLVRKRAGT